MGSTIHDPRYVTRVAAAKIAGLKLNSWDARRKRALVNPKLFWFTEYRFAGGGPVYYDRIELENHAGFRPIPRRVAEQAPA